jgi:hypothetical protein
MKITTNIKRNDITAYEDELMKEIQNKPSNSVRIGEILTTIRNEKLYKMDGYRSFRDYVAIKLPFSIRTAYNYIEIADFFGNGFHPITPEIPYSRLVEVLPILRMRPQSTDLDELRFITLGLAKESSVREIRRLAKELKANGKEENNNTRRKTLSTIMNINSSEDDGTYIVEKLVNDPAMYEIMVLMLKEREELMLRVFRKEIRSQNYRAALGALRRIHSISLLKPFNQDKRVVTGKLKATIIKELGYEVRHNGRNKYAAVKKRTKHRTFNQSRIDLSLNVLMSNEEKLIRVYLEQINNESHEEVMSYLLYRYLLTLKKKDLDHNEYFAVIKLLVEQGAELRYKVTKRRSIFAWAIVSRNWNLVECLIGLMSDELLRELNSEGITTEQFNGNGLVSSRESLLSYVREIAPENIVSRFIQSGCGELETELDLLNIEPERPEETSAKCLHRT